MKKFFAVCIMLAAALIFNCSTKEDKPDYAVISFLMGNVKLNAQSVEIGSIIKENDRLVTDKASFCDVKIGESIIRIKEKSEVIISSLLKNNNIENTKIGLDVGTLLCKPKKLLKSESFIVKTPTAVAAVRGTNFTIESDKKQTTRIKVFNGKIQIAKRIKQFEGRDDKVLEHAPVISESNKIVITRKEVTKTEAAVEKMIQKETKGAEIKPEALAVVIEKSQKNESVQFKKTIESFKVSDFQKEKDEIIRIKPKPPVVIQHIVKAIKEEKKEPTPQGRLYVTRFEIYYILNGKLVWEGNVINQAIRAGNKIYIASGNYVFCASTDGPVFWKAEVPNKGSIKIEGETLLVESTAGGVQKIDIVTGKKI